MIEKNKIIRRFDSCFTTYDGVATVQQKAADFLINQLKNLYPFFEPHSILDIGTGTGYLIEKLLSLYPKSFYHAMDLSPQMITYVNEKFKHFKKFHGFIGDMDHCHNIPLCDLIVSNFALQWSHHLFPTIENIFNRSRVFAFSCLLNNTFQEWYELLQTHGIHPDTKAYYPSMDSLHNLLKGLQPDKFWIHKEKFPITYQTPKEFIRYLKKLGANAYHNSLSMDALKSLLNANTNSIHTNYEVAFCILKK